MPANRLKLANAMLDRAWDRGWASVPTLEPDGLIRKAIARADAAADDDDTEVGWRRRLDLLCSDLDHHARLTSLGRTIAHGQIVSALASRFRAQALWRRHPEIAVQPIRAPIIIVGQMRSGTTRMQRMLACDSRLTFTRFYESWNPIPDGGPRRTFDARKVKGWFGLACARLLNPRFDAIHPTEWHAPDEEIGLHNLSIFGSAFEAQWRVPTYTAAVENGDCVPVYREFKRLLQTLAWLRGDLGDRPWVLKVPQFAQDVPALLTVFPDARLIYLQRKSAAVIASSASLVCNQMILQSHHVDPLWIGQEWTRKVRLRDERMAAARGIGDAPMVDVAYDAIEQDWRSEMQRVYAMLGLPLTPTVSRAISSYLHQSAPHRRERHDYDPGYFGLARAAAMPERSVP